MIKLYSTHCPRCEILAEKLNAKNIKYETITDTDIMLELGFDILPVLQVDGKAMGFTEAVRWINNL